MSKDKGIEIVMKLRQRAPDRKIEGNGALPSGSFWAAGFVGKRLKVAWFIAAVSFVCFSLYASETYFLSQKLLAYVDLKYGPGARQRVVDWQKLIGSNQNIPERDKLTKANSFFNRVPYATDLQHWGKSDYWATPVEMLATNGGDCEDFAIGKYFTLIAMGVPMQKLRTTYVLYKPASQAHVVLAYYSTADAEPLILDNIDKTIWPAGKRDDLEPVFGFNGAGLWLAKERGSGREVGKSNPNSLWNDLISRMNREAE
jgi:predicted transglutaminase-like cysteine proteinase